ncbi:MAG: sulfurtransferase TusA family protein [Eubacteriales bacterium]|nr:sulfurtransferase TusA family protein [Eubacteriales bacterium]
MIDARGFSCPQPVFMLMESMKSGDTYYEIMVDNHAAKENVSRFATSKDFNVEVEDKGNEYLIKVKK